MVIYLISTDGHRDSINLEYYFTTESQVKKYIKKYRKEMFNEKVRNIQLDFDKLEVEFEFEDFDWGDWEKRKHYLFKVNLYE